MGLETRGNHAYYYRKVRRGGRCVSEYCGGGLVAQMMAVYDERDRARGWKERQAVRALAREEEALDAEIDAVCELVEAVAASHLLASGFRRHDRGQWRERRHG